LEEEALDRAMWRNHFGGGFGPVVRQNTMNEYGPTFGNAESRLFIFAAQCFNAESMQKVILWHSCV
jgi:hypothetical protein